MSEERPYSYSAVSKYIHCPYQFYLQYRRGIRDEVGPAAKLGIAVHAALHEAFNLHRQGKAFTLQHLLGVVNDSMLREGLPQQVVSGFLPEAATMISGVDFNGLFNVEGTTPEVSNTFIRQPLGGLAPYQFKYIIDLLVETPPGTDERKAIIWDYKTDKDPVVEKHQLQMSIYRTILMEQRTVPTVGLFVYFLRHRKFLPVQPISPDKVWALLDAVVASVRAQNWTPRPDNCYSPWPCGHRHACEYYQGRGKR